MSSTKSFLDYLIAPFRALLVRALDGAVVRNLRVLDLKVGENSVVIGQEVISITAKGTLTGLEAGSPAAQITGDPATGRLYGYTGGAEEEIAWLSDTGGGGGGGITAGTAGRLTKYDGTGADLNDTNIEQTGGGDLQFTADVDLLPNASGSCGVGSLAFSFRELHADTGYLGSLQLNQVGVWQQSSLSTDTLATTGTAFTTTLSDGAMYQFKAWVVGMCDTGEVGSWELQVGVYRNGGGATMLPAGEVNMYTDRDNSSLNAYFFTVGNDVVLYVDQDSDGVGTLVDPTSWSVVMFYHSAVL